MVSKASQPAVRTWRGLYFRGSFSGIPAHSAQCVPPEAGIHNSSTIEQAVAQAQNCLPRPANNQTDNAIRQEILQELAADKFFTGAAAAIKVHRAEGNVLRRLQEQGAMQHQQGERHQHQQPASRPSRAPPRRPAAAVRKKFQTTATPRPWSSKAGRAGSGRTGRMSFKKSTGCSALVRPQAKKSRAQQPAGQHGEKVHSRHTSRMG